MRQLVLAVVIAATAVLLPTPVVAQGKTDTQAQASARDFVQKFLDWYLPVATSLDRKERKVLVALKRKRDSFDPSLADALRKDEEAQEADHDYIVGFDADPFLSGQDTCDRYVATKVSKKGASYMVDVRGEGGCEEYGAPEVVAEVVQRDGRWIFVNFHYPRVQKDFPRVKADLRSMLKRLADARAEEAKKQNR